MTDGVHDNANGYINNDLLVVHVDVHGKLLGCVILHVQHPILIATQFGPHHPLRKGLCIVHAYENNMQHKSQVGL